MSRTIAGLALMGMFMVGCGQPTSKPVVSTAATPPTQASAAAAFALEDFVVGDGIRFENLTIFPVTSRVPKTEDRFITLDEGLKAGTVEIREVGASTNASPDFNPQSDELTDEAEPISALTPSLPDEEPTEVSQIGVHADTAAGNDVNSLIVINRSDKPLYLMPGEIIIGGSQDRTIGNELVIAAHSEPTRVPVFCVEHGRWGAKGVEETIAQLQNSAANESELSPPEYLVANSGFAIIRLAQEADSGKFVASVGQLGKTGRVAVQAAKDQTAVWDTVAATNSQSQLEPTSGAFTANYVDVDTINRLQPYLEHLQSPVAKVDRAVGVLVAINGKIESIDVFESTPLFQKVWPKLLKSYALDAANSRDEADSKKECARADAESFLVDALQAKIASSETENGVALTKREGQHVLSFSSHVDPVAAPAAGARGGMGGGVHFSGYAK